MGLFKISVFVGAQNGTSSWVRFGERVPCHCCSALGLPWQIRWRYSRSNSGTDRTTFAFPLLPAEVWLMASISRGRRKPGRRTGKIPPASPPPHALTCFMIRFLHRPRRSGCGSTGRWRTTTCRRNSTTTSAHSPVALPAPARMPMMVSIVTIGSLRGEHS